MKDLVRDPGTGEPLLCTWDDCGQWGDNRIQEEYREGGKVVLYIFCSEGHREFWKHSQVENGKLPTGSRTRPGIIVR